MNQVFVDRVRRWTKRADLTHKLDDGSSPPVALSAWVIIGGIVHSEPLRLAVVTDHGSSPGVWVVHDGRAHHQVELTVLDLAGVLEEGAELLRDIRAGRYSHRGDQTQILRVHRSACLARGVARRERLSRDETDVLDALIHLDVEVAETERAWREFLRVGMPNLVAAVVQAGALAMAHDRRWRPNVAGIAHPRWRDQG